MPSQQLRQIQCRSFGQLKLLLALGTAPRFWRVNVINPVFYPVHPKRIPIDNAVDPTPCPANFRRLDRANERRRRGDEKCRQQRRQSCRNPQTHFLIVQNHPPLGASLTGTGSIPLRSTGPHTGFRPIRVTILCAARPGPRQRPYHQSLLDGGEKGFASLPCKSFDGVSPSFTPGQRPSVAGAGGDPRTTRGSPLPLGWVIPLPVCALAPLSPSHWRRLEGRGGAPALWAQARPLRGNKESKP
ncbi:hypothetical protein FF80_01054 [Devosia sp. LC5]|nr:hypothetical protein FF80_01054 [Devosia sp. LC5]